MHRKPLAWLARPALTLATLLALTLLLAMPQMARAQPAYPPGGLSDPPGIVARLNLAEGEVSFAPADANPDAGGAEPSADHRRQAVERPSRALGIAHRIDCCTHE